MRARQTFVVVLALTVSVCFGQNKKELDSLHALLPNVKDTLEADVLYSIARYEFDRDPELAIVTSGKSLERSKELGYVNGLVMAYKQLGVFYNLSKSDMPTAKLYLDSAEQLATTTPQKATVYIAFGILYSQKGEFEQSHSNLMKALELVPSKESRQAFHIYTHLGIVYSRLGRHREAAQAYKRCVSIALAGTNVRDKGIALSNLGSSYMDLTDYDSAFVVYKQLYRFELKNGNPLDNPTLLSELGKLYLERGHRDSAYYFMHGGLMAARQSNLGYVISRSLSTLGQYHLKNRPDSSLYYGRLLYRQTDHNSPLAMEDVTRLLAQAHGKLKHYDSALYFFNSYSLYHDSVFQEKQTKQIAQMEAQFDLKARREEIRALENERKSEVFKRNALAIGLVLVVLVGVLVFFVLVGRIQARKRELAVKNWQLENFTKQMVEKSTLVEELRSKLAGFKSQITVPREDVENLSQILNSSILTEDEWEQFKSLFEQVHPTFFAELKLRHPGLTQAEIRVAALVKLQISTREMANMLGISVDSANKARYRLRKKLELDPEQDLKEFMKHVSEPEPGA